MIATSAGNIIAVITQIRYKLSSRKPSISQKVVSQNLQKKIHYHQSLKHVII